MSHSETRLASKWRHPPAKQRRAGWGGKAASGWEMRRECLGGEGRRRCGGGWGCRRKLPRGRVVATDAGERGEQLDRGGDHILPTRRVREGADGQRQRLWRGGGKVAWQRGAKGSADRSKWQRSSPKVFGTRAGARLRGTPRGACAERARARSGVGTNLHEDAEVFWRHVWRRPPPLPHPSSIAPRPNARRATRWRRRPRAGTSLRRRATASSARRGW